MAEQAVVDTNKQGSEEIEERPFEETVIINSITEKLSRSRAYRDNFKGTWNDIENQVRCVKPSAWSAKEDWQTKIFIPMQAKKSETARAYLDRMLFGQKRFYAVTGQEQDDNERDGHIMDLMDNFIQRGRFHYENDFALHEGVDIGTSFMKILVKDDKNKLNRRLSFHWRSAYNILFDPSVGTEFHKSAYVIDEMTVDISDLIKEVNDGTSLYGKEIIQKFIDHGVSQAIGASETDKSSVKGIDGTTIYVEKAFKSIVITEYWGKVLKKRMEDIKTKDGNKTVEKWQFEDRIVTLFNDSFIARDVENPYGFIPIFMMRCKKRKYEAYGLGFLENTTGLQELMNSMINLGFDSLKMTSMDIIGVDTTKVQDFASIEYKPLAIWKFKGDPQKAMDRSRKDLAALTNIIQGITLLDQIDQEASGVFRQIQGAPDLSTGGSDTLGEFERKLQLIDQRFLKIGRFIERDYIEPMIAGMFRIITNPKFFNQQIYDRILGKKEIKQAVPVEGAQPDPNTGQVQTEEQVVGHESKLIFESLQGDDLGLDFKAVGMTQFFNQLQNLDKIREVLRAVLESPQLMVLSRIDKIWEKALQTAEVPDYEEMIKDEESIKKILEKIPLEQLTTTRTPGGGR